MNQSSTTDSHKLLIPILHIQLQKSEILFNNKRHLNPIKAFRANTSLELITKIRNSIRTIPKNIICWRNQTVHCIDFRLLPPL